MHISSIPTANNRLLFVSNCGWSMYNFRIDVLRNFIDRGYEVHIIGNEDEFTKLLISEGCVFHPVRFNNRGRNILNDIIFYKRLKNLYSQIRPAMIFHYFIKPNIYGTLAAGALNIPNVAIITGLGFSFNLKNWLTIIVKNLYKYALRYSQRIWFLNAEDAALFRSNHIVSLRKSCVIEGEGINTDEFSPKQFSDANKPFIFLMATRLLKSKGIELFANASKLLKQQGYDFECRLIGFLEEQHPDTIRLDQLREWDTAGIITYLGFHGNVKPFLDESQCFVLPSYYQEGMPRSIMEASSMQIPVIASNTKGCKDLVEDNVTGLLFESENVYDLADKMKTMLLMDNQKRYELGRNGRKKMQQYFSLDKIIRHYQHITDQFVERPALKALPPVA